MIQNTPNQCQIMRWAVGDAPLDAGEMIAAIGNFDGVHRGHQQVIEAARSAASARGLPVGVVTFDPHPREFFRHDETPFHLVDQTEKDRLIAAIGVDRIIHVTFDDNLRCTNADEFVTSVLPALDVQALFGGADFAFGRGRGGDTARGRRTPHPVAYSIAWLGATRLPEPLPSAVQRPHLPPSRSRCDPHPERGMGRRRRFGRIPQRFAGG